MKKFRVIVREEISYAVVVEAESRTGAADEAVAVIEQSADRDKYFLGCNERDAINIQELKA